jgi:hypothetical protein
MRLQSWHLKTRRWSRILNMCRWAKSLIRANTFRSRVSWRTKKGSLRISERSRRLLWTRINQMLRKLICHTLWLRRLLKTSRIKRVIRLQTQRKVMDKRLFKTVRLQSRSSKRRWKQWSSWLMGKMSKGISLRYITMMRSKITQSFW